MHRLPTATKLIFLRHGESEGNKDKTMQGRGDYPLSAHGRQQARDARDVVAAWSASLFVASDLSRAYETAQIISAGAPVVRDPRLTERDAGPWEGRPRSEMETAHPGSLEDDHLRPAGFEHDAAVVERILAALEGLARLDGLVVVVGHGATMRVVEDHLTGTRRRYANLEGMALDVSLSWLGRVVTLSPDVER